MAQRRSALPTGYCGGFQASVAQKTRILDRSGTLPRGVVCPPPILQILSLYFNILVIFLRAGFGNPPPRVKRRLIWKWPKSDDFRPHSTAWRTGSAHFRGSSLPMLLARSDLAAPRWLRP